MHARSSVGEKRARVDDELGDSSRNSLATVEATSVVNSVNAPPNLSYIGTSDIDSIDTIICATICQEGPRSACGPTSRFDS